jgi:hypothetical protein
MSFQKYQAQLAKARKDVALFEALLPFVKTVKEEAVIRSFLREARRKAGMVVDA